MRRFVWRQLRARPSRTATLGAGILVAAVSFVLLTSAVSTSALEVRGTVAKNWKTAYDILVRPASSYTPLEREQGLVADNYLSGIFGGITLQQWRQVLSIPGVDVAAPIANIGFVAPFAGVDVSINDVLNRDSVQLYRLRTNWIADRGLSTYSGDTGYVYLTRTHRMRNGAAGYGPAEVVSNLGKELEVCANFNRRLDLVEPNSPFDHSERATAELQCYSSLSPNAARYNAIELPPGQIGWGTDGNFPILVSAIDPAQEQALIGLDGTIASGRTLREKEGPTLQPFPGKPSFRVRTVPVIASTRVYVDQVLHVTVERLTVPPRIDVPVTLASSSAFHFLTSLPGRPVATKSFGPGPIYQDLLSRFEKPEPAISWYWTTSPVHYRDLNADRLAPMPVNNPVEVWENPSLGGLWAAPGNNDLQFRRLQRHAAINWSLGQGNTAAFPALQVVGRFDPAKLPGFSPTSQVPLETYYPPQVGPGDARTRAIVDGKPLLPTMNLGDYIAQPPMMLTTLDGARLLLDSKKFEGTNPRAPISVIRVRVAGVTGPDQVSRERVRRVAQEIRDRTGLAVDITAGSSPHPLLVDLPAGKFGRPALTVREGWTKKGVAFAIVSALDRKSLALFVLILVVSALFLANGAFASVRSRRTEIGTLLCLGWDRRKIFRAVLGELLLVGLTAGLAGTAMAAGLVAVLHLHISLLRTLLVAPVAILVALVAGLVPAMRAGRSVPLDAVRPPVAGPRRAGPVRGIGRMALSNLLRLPGRTLLASAALLVGVAALAFLLAVNLAFRGTLVGTLLGQVISVQVRTVDYVSVSLAVALGAFSVADVLFLNLRERAPEIVTLRTTGWRESHLVRLVALEGAGIGLAGAVPGAAVGLLLGMAVGGHPLQIVGAALFAAAAGTFVATLASLVPALLTRRMAPPEVLAEE